MALPGVRICVDDSRAHVGVSNFLLTHMHADHLTGLCDGWSAGTLICSTITRKLLLDKFDIEPHRVVPMDVGESKLIYTHVVAGREVCVEVTALDANHCPGSVMFTLKGEFGCILHTGDFRFCEDMLHHLRDVHVDLLLIDNTYCHPDYLFPTREEAAERILEIIQKHRHTHRVLIGIDSLGKEELLERIAAAFGTRLRVSAARMHRLILLECRMDFFCTEDEGDDGMWFVKVVSRAHLTHSMLIKCNESSPTIGIMPSGWAINGDNEPGLPAEGTRISTGSSPSSLSIFRVPYSLHSSFSELQRFVLGVKPSHVEGTVPSTAANVKKYLLPLIGGIPMSFGNRPALIRRNTSFIGNNGLVYTTNLSLPRCGNGSSTAALTSTSSGVHEKKNEMCHGGGKRRNGDGHDDGNDSTVCEARDGDGRGQGICQRNLISGERSDKNGNVLARNPSTVSRWAQKPKKRMIVPLPSSLDAYSSLPTPPAKSSDTHISTASPRQSSATRPPSSKGDPHAEKYQHTPDLVALERATKFSASSSHDVMCQRQSHVTSRVLLQSHSHQQHQSDPGPACMHSAKLHQSVPVAAANQCSPETRYSDCGGDVQQERDVVTAPRDQQTRTHNSSAFRAQDIRKASLRKHAFSVCSVHEDTGRALPGAEVRAVSSASVNRGVEAHSPGIANKESIEVSHQNKYDIQASMRVICQSETAETEAPLHEMAKACRVKRRGSAFMCVGTVKKKAA